MSKLKYLNNAYAKSGTLFTDTTLEAHLKYCLTLPKRGIKGKYGSIFVYDSKALGEHLENELSTGVILIDIDNITNDIADKIYDKFYDIAECWGCLWAIQYSASYYINDHKSGLHIFVKSKCIDKYEYKKQAQICLAIFSQLVFKFTGIELIKLNIKDNVVLDFHNTSLYQRFNLFYSTFKYNNNPTEFSYDNISFSDLEKLITTYNLKLDNEIKHSITPTLNNITIGSGKLLKIDRTVHIGNYSGNDIRFRISIIADKIFGDSAKAFCDKFFYFENHKSIYCHYPQGNTINPLIYKWLVENNYIVENKQNIINKWISEYSDQILNYIKNNNHLEIIAPTGCGKTYYINNYLAKALNAVVIVPFNATNALYNNLVEVNSMSSGNIPKNKPVVMIWDQAIRYWNDIRDRYLIIDEAHELFLDRNYRDSAIKLILRLKQRTDLRKVVFITATPTGESKIFNDTKVVEYFKKRNGVPLNINKVKNIEWSQYNYIKSAIDNNWYDKIVLFDDLTAKKIYEKFLVEGYGQDICYIRSNTKESDDFKDLRKNEILRKKLTICTCVAYNGLNFKNTNEKILVIGSIKQGESVAALIIQQVGRIRNSNVHGIYYYNDNFYGIDVDDKRKRTMEKYNMHIPDFVHVDNKWMNADYIEAMKEIEEYCSEYSNINKICTQLGNTGYISGYLNDELKDNDDKILKMSLALKRKESDEMKLDIINNNFLDKEYESDYQSKWMKDINRLISNENYDGIDINMFIKMISKGPKNKLIETFISDIKEIIRVLNINDNLFNKVISNKEQYANMLSDVIDKKRFISNLKKMVDIKNKYQGKIKITESEIYFGDIVKDIIAEEEKNQMKQIKGNIKGGKVTKKIRISSKIKESKDNLLAKYNLKVGQKFKSCGDLASYCKIGPKRVSQWIDRQWVR